MMFSFPQSFGLLDGAEAVRYSFLTVAVWWGLFTIITIIWLPEAKVSIDSKTVDNYVTAGFKQLVNTLKKIRHAKMVFLFLLAYWFYIDGVDTIIRMAVDYGLSLGFDDKDLIAALLIVQFVGFPAALVYGILGERWGVRKSIYLAIGIYMLITIGGTMMTQKYQFYILAFAIALVQGGIQALSRSYYSRLIPKGQEAEYYGFYNMLGKFAVIFGPILMGVVGLIARRILMPPAPTPEQVTAVGQLAARWGIASILILFLLGAILFYFVDVEKGREEAKYLASG
jgi:UMF1 family MFS transporter